MLAGPIFTRELVTAPRRSQHFVSRTAYVAGLFVVLCTAWLVITGTQDIRNASDMGRFGTLVFQLLAPLQLTLLTFISALRTASTVALEKDKKTLLLLLMTRLHNSELILGKLFASSLECLAMLLAALPLFLLIVLLGGVTFEQVILSYAVTLVTVITASSLGCMIAYWREKTFQTLALTALTIVAWTAGCEILARVLGNGTIAGLPGSVWATGLSPARAILVASSPAIVDGSRHWIGDGVPLYLIVMSAIGVLVNFIAIIRVRVWNPSREARPQGQEEVGHGSIWTADHDVANETEAIAAMRRREQAEAARLGHVDARVREVSRSHRRVWDNPILWREMCTWAYGRKVLLIRAAYFLISAMAVGALVWMIQTGAIGHASGGDESLIPAAARSLGPFFFVSLVIVNALAVTSITNERDSGAIDLLMVTDLTPREFLLGKLLGVAYVVKEMIVVPMLLCLALWWFEGITTENLAYLLLGLLVMDLFVIMLGLHCGMHYANSRSSIGVSLGSVFFLFIGVVTLLVMMVSFSGSFATQLAPFLAFIVGGSAGLFMALGARNPSQAIGLSSILLPFLTFFAITSFLLHHPLNAFVMTAVAYGLTTASMMVPALGEFDFAMGRAKSDTE